MARIRRSGDPSRRFHFVGYRQDEPEGEFLYIRDAEGTWKDEANGEVADRALTETFDYLCTRADEGNVDDLKGVYSDNGPAVLDM